MTTAPLRVAVAGAGIIAGVHLANLATLEGVELCGLADLDVDRARALAPPGVPVHPRAEALLDGAPDALVVCLPPAARADLIERAAAAGVHVFVEKPAALTLDAARRTLGAVEAAGIVAAVGHMWRSTAAARAMAAALGGAPHVLLGRLLNGPPGPAWSGAGNRCSEGTSVPERRTAGLNARAGPLLPRGLCRLRRPGGQD